MMVNRYEVRTVNPDGTPGELLAIAQQKRLAMKERVTFFADEARTTPVFSFAARNILELAAVYDVFDAAGTAIGYFQKDFAASMLRSSFHLVGPGIDAYGQERNQARRDPAPLHRLPVLVPLRLRQQGGRASRDVQRSPVLAARPLHGRGAGHPRRLPARRGDGGRTRRPAGALSPALRRRFPDAVR